MSPPPERPPDSEADDTAGSVGDTPDGDGATRDSEGAAPDGATPDSDSDDADPAPQPAETDDADAVDEAAVQARLDDALERVAHGAAVSVPSILLHRALTVAFTAALTNGFSAAAYGLFALARRLQRFLVSLTMGFGGGMSRFLPNADTDAERDALATFAVVLMVGVATLFGVFLFAAAPLLTTMVGESPRFQLYLRVFSVGLPAGVWLFTVAGVLRALEEVGPLNLTIRLGFPLAQLVVGLVGAYVLGDLVLVAVGVVAMLALTGTLAALWLARERGLSPRLRGENVRALQRQYLEFTVPLFLAGFATTTQRLGFYPLIVVFLSGVAGGVFAVGVLLGMLVRLPLMGINQFISPVAAALNEENHREALKRLYHVTSRIVLVGVTGLAIPVIVYRETVMGLFGPTFVEYAWLLPGFILAQYAACAAGSVGILLMMTDNQRAMLVVNVFITAILAVVAIPLTAIYGLPGLVASYLLMLTLNNGLEVVVLYYLEGLQPFTWLHGKPLLAGIPLAGIALLARAALGGVTALLVGSLLGLAAYALTMRTLGFTHTERRLAATLADRYRGLLPDTVR